MRSKILNGTFYFTILFGVFLFVGCGPSRSTPGDDSGVDDADVLNDAQPGVDRVVGLDVQVVAECGDGIVQGSEECDDGAQNSDTLPNACRTDCTLPRCGDGVIDPRYGDDCEESDLAEQTCASLGMGEGTLGCNNDCSYDFSQCSVDPTLLTWIPIPGGSFDMGSLSGDNDEAPVRSVTVPDFEMTMTPITVSQYNECFTAGACDEPGSEYGTCNWNEPGYEDHPVNCVDWFGAVAYCSWLGARLPTEAEWEYAAKSAGQANTYPWGNDVPNCTYAVMKGAAPGCGTDRTMSVCRKALGRTAQGLCDMAGNLWEWVQDQYYMNYTGAPTDGSAREDLGTSARVLRGGSYYNVRQELRTSNRSHYDPTLGAFDNQGFRCAR